MSVLLFLGLLVIAALVVGAAFTFLGFVIGALLWLVMLPFRLLFKLTFGLLRGLFRLLFTPVFMLVAMVAIAGAFIAGMVALLAPLLPLLLLGGVGWGVYRSAHRRSIASF